MMPPGKRKPGGDQPKVDAELIAHPVVRELRAVDDELLALERRYSAQKLAIDRKFDERYAPLLEQRRSRLAIPKTYESPQAEAAAAVAAALSAAAFAAIAGQSDVAGSRPPAPPKATPAIPGFWKIVLQNSADFNEFIEVYDEPVLDYLRDIAWEPLDDVTTWRCAPSNGAGFIPIRTEPHPDAPLAEAVLQAGHVFRVAEERELPGSGGATLLRLADGRGWVLDRLPNGGGALCTRAEAGLAGFRLRFYFEPNPFFSNAVLEKVYHSEVKNPFVDRLDCMRIQAPRIDWAAGKNVTVEIVTKKPKGGGRKRQTKAKREEVPRPSFFRYFFRSLGPENEIPEEELEDMEEDEDDFADLMDCLVNDDYDQALALRDHIVPHAIRWYTGDACDVDEDDDDDDEESDVGSADLEPSDGAAEGEGEEGTPGLPRSGVHRNGAACRKKSASKDGKPSPTAGTRTGGRESIDCKEQ